MPEPAPPTPAPIPAPAPTPACDPSAAPDTLTRETITAGVKPVRADAKVCGARVPAITGVVKVHAQVSPDGSVTDAVAFQSPDRDLGECVAAAMRKATFACSQRGGSFSYPFVF